MLENLPAKRICKKIFPVDNKAKRKAKNKAKAKSMAKSLVKSKSKSKQQRSSTKRIYNQHLLRTTRSRSRSSVVATGSSAAAVAAQQQRSRRKQKQQQQKQQQQKQQQKKQEQKAKLEKVKSPPEPPAAVESDQMPAKTEARAPAPTVTAKSRSPAEEKPSLRLELPQTLPEAAAPNVSVHETEPASPTPSKQLMPTPPTTPAPATKSPPAAAAVAPPFCAANRQTTPNSTVKRSKRISDCIAMLTGKLEEKLKTEQVPPPGPLQKEKEKPQQDRPAEKQDKTPQPVDHQSPAAAVVAEKERVQPKTPKRKAVSRRIIKMDATPETLAEPIQERKPVAMPPAVPPPAVAPAILNAAPAPPALQPPIFASMPVAVPVVPAPVPPPPVAAAAPLPVAAIVPLPVAAPAPPPVATALVHPPTRRTPTKAAAKQMGAPPPKPPASLAALKQYPPLEATLPVPPTNSAPPVPVAVPLVPVPVPVPVPVAMPLGMQGMPVPVNVNMLPKLPLYMTQLQAPANPNPNPNPAPTAMFVMADHQPLNLTSQRGVLQKPLISGTTGDPGLVGLQHHRAGGMPARRQTICGFEARNLIGLDMEMEPLDLSKKSSRKPSPVPPPRMQQELPMPLVPLPLVTNANALAPQSQPGGAPLPTPVGGAPVTCQLPMSGVSGVPGVPAPLASHYYSNLDLLKIPQVRNPGTGVVVPSSGPPAVSASAAVAAPVHPVKSSGGKKRSTEGTGSSKKDNGKGQAKACPRMDEVVNNHIDDAINSVIMAVQASFPDDDEEEQQAKKEKEREREREREREKEKLEEPPLKPSNCIMPLQACAEVLPSAVLEKSQAVNAIPAIVAPPVAVVPVVLAPQPVPVKNLTPKKRSMRSRTIDCRSALLALEETLPAASLPQCIPLPVNGDAKEEMPSLPDPIPAPTPAVVEPQLPVQVQGPTTSLRDKKTETVMPCTNSTTIPTATPLAESPESPDPVPVNLPQAETSVPAPVPVSVISVAPAVLPLPTRTATPPPTTMAETNCSSLMEEHSSNLNNNTSSGFHSLAQSEQPIPTAATTAEEAPPVKEDEELPAKKKQRRRRKNELAAIVADQLLESFKIDNARRDNLKKLENLAYEKSEDLLLTGMLLMPSTKRNAALGPSSAAAAKLAKKEAADTVAESPANSPVRGRPKRRQSCYYRRGKAGGVGGVGKATNENISLLKSSLESFSIGIEKQLLAKEAREAKEAQPAGGNNQAQLPVSSILRPSILSSAVAREQQLTRQQQSKLDKQEQLPPAATFSRDPRLNKNIHKEQADHKAAPKEQSATATTNENPEEDDNYLTEIAKNVNEKIMSATTNEDFEFAHDEFDGEGDPDQDQDQDQDKYYRPPTSMSVRSAPNLNDEHSNFGSMCDDNTNTEVMDMDLDDEMSVYTSYSQDLGRGGRGRRRRRRRSVLLTRRPKKRTQRSELDAEKFGCKLCGKSFFTATSLSKHNMTLAHVSKVSAQEYLQSQTAPSSPQDGHDLENKRERQAETMLQHQEEQPAAAQQQMRASVLMVPAQMAHQERERVRELQRVQEQERMQLQREQEHRHQQQQLQQQQQHQQQQEQVHHVITEASLRLHDNQHSPTAPTASRLNLNPDERLFYECCNILKSAETPRPHPGGGAGPAPTSVIVTAGRKQPPPPPASPSPSRSSSLPPPASPSPSLPPPASPSLSLPPPASPSPSPSPPPPAEATAPAPVPAAAQPAANVCHQPVIQQLFRNPPAVTPTTTPT